MGYKRRRTNPKARKQVNTLFDVTTHRWPALPRARVLGVTDAQRHAIVRIRRLYGEVIDSLSYMSTEQCEHKLQEAEHLIQTHFPADWRAIVARREAEVQEFPGATVLDAEEGMAV